MKNEVTANSFTNCFRHLIALVKEVTRSFKKIVIQATQAKACGTFCTSYRGGTGFSRCGCLIFSQLPVTPFINSVRGTFKTIGERVGCHLISLAFTFGALHAATFYVTIAGLGGEPEYEQRFTAQAQEIDKLIRASSSDAKIQTLFGKQATKAQLQSVLSGIAREAKSGDTLVLMIIGHGSFDGFDYKVNLPGPDISAVELAALLDRIPTSRQLVVNMTSASGGSRAALEKQNRAVITATKSGSEKNATVFARYWVEALRDSSADTDKNESISALEAFLYAEQKTSQFFESQKRIATEHPTLVDSGQGDGTRKPSPENGEGLVASQITLLHLGAAQAAANTPEKKALLARREQLEQDIDKLKYQKAAIPIDVYKQQLQALLLELAKTQAELDK